MLCLGEVDRLGFAKSGCMSLSLEFSLQLSLPWFSMWGG